MSVDIVVYRVAIRLYYCKIHGYFNFKSFPKFN